MKLVSEIIDLLSSNKPSLQNALFKAQVLAHKMAEAELREWIDHELKGYPIDAELPSYRTVQATVLGNVSNGGYRYTEQPLPLNKIDPEIREKLQSCRLTQSIAVIEQWSKNDSALALTVPPELYPFLSSGLSNGYAVEKAWRKYSVGAMLQVVTEVRSRLLDFALKINDKLPNTMEPNDIRIASKEMAASDIFRNSVFGDNTTIVVGSGSIQGINNAITKDNFSELSQSLRNNAVPEEDILKLKEAIKADKDAIEVQQGSFGLHVRTWLGNMISKAGTSAWNISIGAAGNILASALSKYYGIP